jgi:hypothetical protein
MLMPMIGARGVNVQQLQHDSGCRIDVQKAHDMAPGATMRAITITHREPERRAMAEQLVRQKYSEYSPEKHG